jgi:hypothetical protein
MYLEDLESIVTVRKDLTKELTAITKGNVEDLVTIAVHPAKVLHDRFEVSIGADLIEIVCEVHTQIFISGIKKILILPDTLFKLILCKFTRLQFSLNILILFHAILLFAFKDV